MVTPTDDQLSDAEFWILLSLDAAHRLPELLSSIVVHDRDSKREIRPRIDAEAASAAMDGLVQRGAAEISDRPRDALDVDVGPPFTTEVARSVLRSPASWRYPDEEGRKPNYWAAITPAGEEAYVRAELMRRSPEGS